MNDNFKLYNKQANYYLTIFFKILHVCFGYDFGFIKYKTAKIKCVAKLLCFIQSLLISFSCIWALVYEKKFSPLFLIGINYVFGQYVTYVLIFLFKRSDVTILQLYSDIQIFDLKLSAYKAIECVEKRFILLISFCYMYRILLIAVYCSISGHCIKPVWVSILYFLVSLTCDTVLMINTYVYYTFYYRLRIFSTNLKTNDINLWLPHHCLYKSFADVVEKYKNAYDSLVHA